MRKELEEYVGLVTFLGKVFGPQTEVALQDLTNLDASVVAIANGHISGRAIGAPATDLVLKILKDGTKGNREFINYSGTVENGHTLRSSTYLIRDKEEKIIGMLCINRDISDLEEMQSIVSKLLNQDSPTVDPSDISETFAKNSAELTLGAIQKTITQSSIPAERMSVDEKLDIIRQLNQQGVFLLKGAIWETSQALKVSEPTVYRYLGIIKKEG